MVVGWFAFVGNVTHDGSNRVIGNDDEGKLAQKRRNGHERDLK